VLFDPPPGPPWPIHGCWKDHMRRSKISSVIESSLATAGFNGRFYQPQGVKISSPRNGETNIAVSGYVADNHALYELPQIFRLRSHRRAASIALVFLEVSTGEDIYPFVISQADAKEIADFSLIEVRGTWKRKGRYWYLFATSLRQVQPGKRRGKFSPRFALNGTCAACGCDLAKSALWGLDDKGLEECNLCGAMRGNMTHKSFLKHVLSIRTQCV
jgi:hypothetical protein